MKTFPVPQEHQQGTPVSALAMAVAFEGLLLTAASGQPLAISGHGEALFPVAKVRKPEPIVSWHMLGHPDVIQALLQPQDFRQMFYFFIQEVKHSS